MYLVKLHREETPKRLVGNTLNPPKEIWMNYKHMNFIAQTSKNSYVDLIII